MSKTRHDDDLSFVEDAEKGVDRELELGSVPSLEIDPADYLDDIADFDGTREQHLELLERIAQILWTAVQIGYTRDICEWFSTEFGFSETPTADCETITLSPIDVEGDCGSGGAE